MSGESDFDDDIDKLLDEIDSAGQQKKGSKPSLSGPSKPTEETEGSKVTLKSDGNGIKVNFGGGGFKLSDLSKPAEQPKAPTAKSVHFPADPAPAAPEPVSSVKPNFLSNLLGKEKRPESPVKLASKSDWLGLGPSSSPPSSPKSTRKPARTTSGGGNDSTINFDDDEDNEELLKAMGLDSTRKPKATEEPKKAPTTTMSNPSATKRTGGFDLDDDFWPKPGSLKPTSAPAKTESTDKVDPVPASGAASALLQRAKLARGREESPFESLSTPKFQPTAASTPQATPQSKSIVDVLPFLKRSDETQPESLEPPPPPLSTQPARSLSSTPQPQPTATARNQTPTPGVTGTKKVKKAVTAVATSGAIDGRTTLQLPSHLVDEEELKSMCHSLKTLYSNQIEMLEKSYQEQMDCLLQSHARKEELLKEEIKVLHKEYDARLTRLKNELLETEAKPPHRYQHELSSMTSYAQQVPLSQPPQPVFKPNIEADSPRSVQQPANSHSLSGEDIEKIFEEKIATITQSFRSLAAQSPKELKDFSAKLETVQKRLEALASYKAEEEAKRTMQLIDSEKKLVEELGKIHKQQRKMKEGLLKATVTAVSQTLQYYQDDNSSKKDKIASQMKEFRKDVRRVLFDLESKNETMQKSQMHVEADQKEILQTLRDLQTLIQVNSVQNKFASLAAIPQQFLNSGQNQPTELEIKLLREERNALSESIAQMNVERRKLNEEKLNLEQEKMNIEREKNRLRDLEVQLRVKTAEAEDMRKQAEEVRKNESAKVMEATMKASEIEKERAMLKEQHYLNENKLRVREHKLVQEKSELMREKEFLEKLRDQLLCPGCMKSVNQLTSRSEGDGLDLSFSADVSSKLTTALLPDDRDYFRKESLYLDDLYYKQFNAK